MVFSLALMNFILRIYNENTELPMIVNVTKTLFIIMIIVWANRILLFDRLQNIDIITNSNFISSYRRTVTDLIYYIFSTLIIIIIISGSLFLKLDSISLYFALVLLLISVYIYLLINILKIVLNNNIIVLLSSFVFFIMMSNILYTLFLGTDFTFLVYSPFTITELLIYNFSLKALIVCLVYIFIIFVITIRLDKLYEE